MDLPFKSNDSEGDFVALPEALSASVATQARQGCLVVGCLCSYSHTCLQLCGVCAGRRSWHTGCEFVLVLQDCSGGHPQALLVCLLTPDAAMWSPAIMPCGVPTFDLHADCCWQDI